MAASKSVAEERKSASKIYLTYDFEAYDLNVWWSVAFVVAEYPSGHVLLRREFFADRSALVVQHDRFTAFWDKHPDARQYITTNSHGKIAVDQEKAIVALVAEIIAMRPHIFVVSDHPKFDENLLDDILLRHGAFPLENRQGDIYLQTLCTWSYRHCLMDVLGCSLRRLQTHSIMTREVQRDIDSQCSIAHTALNDCYTILRELFKTLDLVHAMRQRFQMQ